MPISDELTIATYNILFAINKKQILDNIQHLAEDGIDVFCLQEVINKKGEELIITNMLRRLGKHWRAVYHMGTELSKSSIGTAILWNNNKLKWKSDNKILLPKLNKFDLHEKLLYKLGGKAPLIHQRKVISGLFLCNDTKIRITNVHADNIGGARHRQKQFSFLISELKSLEKADKEVICGDFNTFELLKTGSEKKRLQKALGDNVIEASNAIPWTSDLYYTDFSTSVPLVRWLIEKGGIHLRRKLDYIWVKNIVVKACYKQNISGSDHFPVVAKLQI